MNTFFTTYKTGFIIALAVLILGFLLFLNNTGAWLGSFFAALLSAALVFLAYIVIDWLILIFKK